MHNYTLNPPEAEARDMQNTPEPPPGTKPYKTMHNYTLSRGVQHTPELLPGTKPFLWKTEPITRFRTDDGKVYLEQFHALRGVYDEESKALSVKIAGGTITATGPGAWEACESLCAGKATMIRSDGVEITSVVFYPKELGVEL